MMPGFVGMDWGSTRLRAYLFDAAGVLVDRQAAELGLRNMARDRFAEVFRQTVAPWRDHVDRVFLSGMVTSRTGWLETPYLSCPARLADLPGAAKRMQLDGLDLIFLPGLSQQDPPDVMRGEELQLFGLGGDHGDGLVVLPGTHSKWVHMTDGRVDRFRTIITGELYALILDHSLIGALADGRAADRAAFAAAVAAAFRSDTPLADLFALRAEVLLGSSPSRHLAARLSGRLIGAEIREAFRALGTPQGPVTIIGSDELSGLYADALAVCGIACTPAATDVTSRGFADVARGFHADSARPSRAAS